MLVLMSVFVRMTMGVTMIVIVVVVMSSSKMIVTITLMKNVHLNKIEAKPKDCCHKHNKPFNLLRHPNSLSCLY